MPKHRRILSFPRHFLFVALSLLLAAGVPPIRSPAAQERGQGLKIKVGNNQTIDLYDESHALVIGVSDYNNGWRKLPGVKTDVEQVSAVLEKQGFKVTRVLDPTRETFDAAIRRFLGRYGLRERNRLVIYFAGHGHTERLSDDRDLGYIVMRNAPRPESDPGLFSECAVSMDEINAIALRFKAKHVLFLFDSCFAGTIFRSETNRRVPPRISSKAASPVRQFITSGTAGQEVPDESIFRQFFVRAFEQGEGDLNDDGYITGEELGQYLKGNVASDSRDTQTPMYGKIREAKLSEGDVVFEAPKKEPPPILQPPAPAPTPVFDPAAIELEVWRSADKSNDLTEYEEYLRQYPQGRFAVIARNRIARLKSSNTATTNTTAKPKTRPRPEPPLVPLGEDGKPLRSFSFSTASVDSKGKIKNHRHDQTWGFVEDLGNGVKLEIIRIPAGDFVMGAPKSEVESSENERPQHQVNVAGLYMGRFEVTREQWRAVAHLPKVAIDFTEDPANFKDSWQQPVESISWEEAVEFCARLKQKTGKEYRLPSEAEWEYAARAGTTTPFAYGETITPEIVNYNGKHPYGSASKGTERKKTVPVGSLSVANAFGLFDMHGNVWELVQDTWHRYYQGAPSDGTAWIGESSSPNSRVLRGGSWNFYGVDCRSAFRRFYAPGDRNLNFGFRIAVSAKPQ